MKRNVILIDENADVKQIRFIGDNPNVDYIFSINKESLSGDNRLESISFSNHCSYMRYKDYSKFRDIVCDKNIEIISEGKNINVDRKQLVSIMDKKWSLFSQAPTSIILKDLGNSHQIELGKYSFSVKGYHDSNVSFKKEAFLPMSDAEYNEFKKALLGSKKAILVKDGANVRVATGEEAELCRGLIMNVDKLRATETGKKPHSIKYKKDLEQDIFTV